MYKSDIFLQMAADNSRVKNNVYDEVPTWKRFLHGPLTRYVKLRVAHAPGMRGTFSPPLWVSDPDMHHGTCVTYVPWCMPGSLTSGFLWSLGRGKRSRHSRRMRNPQLTYLVRSPFGGRFTGNKCMNIFSVMRVSIPKAGVKSFIKRKDAKKKLQWNPSIKDTQDGGLSKEVAYQEGQYKYNLERMVHENRRNFATSVRHSWPFKTGSIV